MDTCIACGMGRVKTLLDLGDQPPSNLFLSDPGEPFATHGLTLGRCEGCGHVQLVDPMPVAMVKPRFPWLAYNEPEGHLDDVVERFQDLPGVGCDARIYGLTYKEDSTLERLRSRGFGNLYRCRGEDDLGVPPDAGLELIQASVTTEKAEALVQGRGAADLLFARHILEHAHAPIDFTTALARMVKPGGYLAFEVPDSFGFMRSHDYPFIWEEHISYFFEDTLKSFLDRQGLGIICFVRYEYPFEDSLVIVTRVGSRDGSSALKIRPADGTEEVVGAFAAEFDTIKTRVRRELRARKEAGHKIGIFGAGHLAIKFVNFFDLSECLEFVLDDHPGKQGLLMPGSGLPIVPSKHLRELDLCLLSLSPESEGEVIAKQVEFVESGGEFRSIFAASPISIVAGN